MYSLTTEIMMTAAEELKKKALHAWEIIAHYLNDLKYVRFDIYTGEDKNSVAAIGIASFSRFQYWEDFETSFAIKC